MYVEALNAEFCWAIMVYVANLNLQQFLKDENIHRNEFSNLTQNGQIHQVSFNDILENLDFWTSIAWGIMEWLVQI